MSEQPEFVLPTEIATEEAFLVDLGGFEGPLDLLLTLARQQKVDLREISILKLANQYIAFIDEARKKRLELAADYLVMAAWLAFLKSKLLLPAAKKEEVTGLDLAENLQAKLLRLETIRFAAARLMTRPRLERDVFARGEIQPLTITKNMTWQASLYDLLTAYAAVRRKADAEVKVEARQVVSLKEARELLERLIGLTIEWTALEDYILDYIKDSSMKPTIKASSFSAILEMVKEGRLEVSQSDSFAPIYLRTRVD